MALDRNIEILDIKETENPPRYLIRVGDSIGGLVLLLTQSEIDDLYAQLVKILYKRG